jgi:hypothetical protein
MPGRRFPSRFYMGWFAILAGTKRASMSYFYSMSYDPPDPTFGLSAHGGQLVKSLETRVAELSRPQNLGQPQAMETKLAKGEQVTGYDGDYGWVYDQKVGDFFGAIIAFVILPWLVLRVAPALAERMHICWPRKRDKLS